MAAKKQAGRVINFTSFVYFPGWAYFQGYQSGTLPSVERAVDRAASIEIPLESV